MVSVDDTINNVRGMYYLQSVHRSISAEGTRTKLTLRKPGLFNPALQALND
jgi:hypothetical protein